MLDKLLIILKDLRTAFFLLKFMYRGYLFDIGWIQSRKKHLSIDRKGEPIPWLTYPFIEFLKGRLHKRMNIFEYGAGNSTLFYARAVNSVVAVENNTEWYKYIKSKMPGNVKLVLHPDDPKDYVTYIRNTNQYFDIIIVDGRHRVSCIKESIKYLTDGGVVILDNSDREKYREGAILLAQSGFKRLDFWGLAPSAPNNTCTTLFYRTNNVFGV